MSSVNTNIGALVAQKNMAENSRSLDQAMNRLSSGKRINSAADDAAGSAIASKMESQVRSLDMAIRNSYVFRSPLAALVIVTWPSHSSQQFGFFVLCIYFVLSWLSGICTFP